jgi:hypothetical protein
MKTAKPGCYPLSTTCLMKQNIFFFTTSQLSNAITYGAVDGMTYQA